MLPVPFGQVYNRHIPANFITGIVRVKKNKLKMAARLNIPFEPAFIQENLPRRR
jgi:hypothetical protein